MKLKKIAMFGALLSLLFAGAVCQAQSEESWVMKPVRKLSRGVANVAFGALEIPMKVYDINTTSGGIPGITYGPIKGICFFVAREVVGVIDVATFPVPLPGCPDNPNDFGYGYGPIMTPEWVVDPAHNAFNFFYDDQAIVATPY